MPRKVCLRSGIQAVNLRDQPVRTPPAAMVSEHDRLPLVCLVSDPALTLFSKSLRNKFQRVAFGAGFQLYLKCRNLLNATCHKSHQKHLRFRWLCLEEREGNHDVVAGAEHMLQTEM